jgi:hypothetical protein
MVGDGADLRHRHVPPPESLLIDRRGRAFGLLDCQGGFP